MKKALLISAAVIALSGPAIAQDQPGHASPPPNTTNDTMSAVKDTAGHAVGVVSAEMTTTLQGFVPAAAISDMYEVEAAQIAQQRSHNADVVAFAKKMEKAHTETTQKLKAILSTMNGAVTPPAHLDDRRQGMIDELRGAKDADFDNRYISQQIDAHKEALILMQGYAKSGDAAAVKQFAAKTALAVQSHLNMAEHISGKLPKN